MKKNNTLKQPYQEVPFTISLDRFLPQIEEDESEHTLKINKLKLLTIDKAFEILTDVQLVIFIMRFVFGMKHREIANSLKSSKAKRVNLMSYTTMCQSFIKRQDKFIKFYDDEFKECLSYVRSYRKTREEELCLAIETTMHRFKQLKDVQIADRMAKRNLKGKYERSVRKMVKKVESNPELIKDITKNLPINVTTPYVMGVLKTVISKLKVSFIDIDI